MGTPEGGSSLNLPRSAKKPIPGDMSEQSQSFAKRRPPSPGMGMMSMSPKTRPPSPGMGMMSARGPPSPGMGAMTTPKSSRGPPSPGRLSPAPPGASNYPSSVGSRSPERQKSVRFEQEETQEPSSPAVASQSADQNMNASSSSDELSDERSASKKGRFVFTKAPTGVQPPKRIDVASTNQDQNMKEPQGTYDDASKIESEAVSNSFPDAKGRPNPKSKKDNPLRNNPLFLQKFAESSDSESDSDDDTELQKLNGTGSSTRSINKLSSMQKMKKLAAMSSTSLMSPGKNQSPQRQGGAGASPKESKPVGTPTSTKVEAKPESPPLIIIDATENEDPQKGDGDDKRGNFAKSPSHWSRVSKSPRRISRLAESLKKKPIPSPKSSPMNNSNESEKSLIPSPTDEVDSDENPTNSPDSPHKFEDKPSAPETAKPVSPTKKQNSSSSFISRAKARKDSPSRKQSAVQSPVAAKSSSTGKTPPSLPSNQAEENTKGKKKLTISEKLEKKRPVGPKHELSDASLSSRSMSSGMSRREMLDRVKGRISRSPSPSPLLKKHMNPQTSPKSSVLDNKKSARKLSVMKKMIEAREKKSHDDESTLTASVTSMSISHKKQKAAIPQTSLNPAPSLEESSSSLSDMAMESIKNGNRKGSRSPQRPLQPVPSLVTAPSDEKVISRTNSSEKANSETSIISNENLSVKKGLDLLKQQTMMMNGYRPQAEKLTAEAKENHQSKENDDAKENPETKEKLSQNVSRLRILQEKQKKREEMKQQIEDEKKARKPKKSRSKPINTAADGFDDEDISVESTPKDVEDEDDFSIDEFPMMSPGFAPDPSPSSTLMGAISPAKRSRKTSQWAKKMQQKLRNSNSPQNFNFDEDDVDSWGSDVSEEESPQPEDRKINKTLPKTKPPIAKNTRASAGSPNPFQKKTTNNVSFRRNEKSPIRQPSPKGEYQGDNIYAGAYSELLPRRSNPLLVKVINPTLPSSLMAARNHISRIAEATNNKKNSAAEETYDERISMQEAPSEEYLPSSQFQPSESEAPPMIEEAIPMKPKFAEPIQIDTPQWNQSPPSNHNHQDLEYTEDFSRLPTHESKSSDLFDREELSQVDSTLIGQVHVSSMDESTNLENRNSSESVADWWKNSYAHTQKEEVIRDVQSSLSRNIIQDDSDDDVFFGIEEEAPPKDGRSKKRDTRKQSSRNKPVKAAPVKSMPVQKVPSVDSEFDQIMNEEPEPSTKKDSTTPNSHSLAAPPPPPPPPPDSTPPNRPTSAKRETRKNVSIANLSKDAGNTSSNDNSAVFNNNGE